jgi:hypothetical protein
VSADEGISVLSGQKRTSHHAVLSLDQTGAAGGAFTSTFVGFSHIGWKTSQRAWVAQEQADTVAVTVLVPFCVAKAEQPSEQAALVRSRQRNPSSPAAIW